MRQEIGSSVNKCVGRYEIRISYPSRTNKSLDEDIRDNTLDLLGRISKIDSEFLEVSVSDGIVIIEGTVDSFLKKSQIEEIILESAPVLDIVNKIRVNPVA
jgi:osmotically-inducible protein OsmY